MEQLVQLLAEEMLQQAVDRQQKREYRQRKEQQDKNYLLQQQEEQVTGAEMKQLLQLMAEGMRQQQAERKLRQQKEQRDEEYRRQQLEEQRRRDQREEELRRLLQTQMQETIKVNRPTMEPRMNMAPFDENEDIQDFLEAFEGIMAIQKIDHKEWVLRLTPLLKGKARTVCIDVGTLMDYDEVKKSILSHYSVSPERCRKAFRAHTWTRDAEPNAWIARGRKLMNRWLLPEEGMEQVLDKIAVEQFVTALPQELRIWVASHSPETPAAVARLIEAYDSAHTSTGNRGKAPPQDYKPRWKSDSKERDRWKKEGPQRNGSGERKPPAEIICYKCNKKGHLARNCTTKTLHVQEEKNNPSVFVEGEVNGQPVSRIQLDSGASRTVVRRNLISPTDIGERSIVVTFGNGTCGEYPLATISVKVDEQEYRLEAAVVQDLAEEVLLGRDVPLYKHMVKRLSQEEKVELLQQLAKETGVTLGVVQSEERPEKEKALAIMTRAQSRARNQNDAVESQEETLEDAVESQEGTLEDAVESQEETLEDDVEFQEETQEDAIESHEEAQEDDVEFQEGTREDAIESDGKTQEDAIESREKTQEDVVETQEEVRDSARRMQESIRDRQDDGLLEKEFPFDDELFEAVGKTRPRQTRAGKRKHNKRWTSGSNGSTSVQLRKVQEEDPQVQSWMVQEDPTRVKRVNGVLCRIRRPRDSQDTVYEQIVLPRKYHQRVIKLAHAIPFSGHLGREKTAQRILRRFYWTTLFQDVKQYCQTCEECQLHGGRRTRAPMTPLPVMGEPFRRIAMDIVGPLPRTGRGNHFILVVSDYATRYPEAVPLRSISAGKIAEVLIDLFARHGIPEEILT